MRKKILITCIAACFFLCLFSGCEKINTSTPPPGDPPGGVESEQKSVKTAQNAEELYAEIITEMNYDEVMQVMDGHKPFLQNEGAINTPLGQIITDNVSWKIGKSIITVIFEDKIVVGKDLTTT